MRFSKVNWMIVAWASLLVPAASHGVSTWSNPPVIEPIAQVDQIGVGNPNPALVVLGGNADTSGCCLKSSSEARTGNIDCDPDGGVDLSDLERMIDCLYMGGQPLCCVGAADLIWDGSVDIGDLTELIGYLYIWFSPTPPCH